MKKWLLAVVGLITMIVMVAGCASPEKVITPEEFYRGKVVTIMIPYSPGGGYDIMWRVMSPFFTKEIGAKVCVVHYMTGGGGIVGMNWMYSSAPRDGLTIGFFTGSILLSNDLFDVGEPLSCKSPSEYDVIGMWGSDRNQGVTMANPNFPYNSWPELKGATDVIKMGSSTIFAGQSFSAVSIAEILGLRNMKCIIGYGGTAECITAAFRGELSMAGVTTQQDALAYAKQGMLKVMGTTGTGLVEGYPNNPGLATMPGAEKWTEIREMINNSTLRFFTAPPGIPKDRLDFLRQVCKRTLENPDLLEAFNARGLGAPADVRMGEEAAVFLVKLRDMPQSEKDYIKNTMLSYIP